MKKKKIPNNIPAMAEPPLAEEAEETNQKQCGSDTKLKKKRKKILILRCYFCVQEKSIYKYRKNLNKKI